MPSHRYTNRIYTKATYGLTAKSPLVDSALNTEEDQVWIAGLCMRLVLSRTLLLVECRTQL